MTRFPPVRPALLVLAAILMVGAGASWAPASSRQQKAEPASSKRAPAIVEVPGAAQSDAQVDPEVMESTRRRFNEVLER